MEEKVKAPFWKPALIYGAILGFVSVFLSLIFYFIGLNMQSWTQWVIMGVNLILLVYLMLHYRREYLGGFARFGQIFLMVLVASGVVSTIITVLYQYLLFTVIDPGLLEQARIMAEDRIMNNSRIPESMYDDLLERIAKTTTVSYMTRMGLIVGPILSAVIGLIVAAFIKKDEDVNMPA